MEKNNTLMWIVIGVAIFLLAGNLILNRSGYGMMPMMYGNYGFGMMFFGWIFGGLVLVALVLLIMWLSKQLQKK